MLRSEYEGEGLRTGCEVLSTEVSAGMEGGAHSYAGTTAANRPEALK